MLRRIMFFGLILVFTVGMSVAQAFAASEEELEKEASNVAKLLISCRAVIAANQGLFNNPEVGDKGFTGDVYVSKVIEHFKNATGAEISESDATSSDPVKKALGTLLVSTKKVIDESQKVLNTKGKGFKKVIPAIVGRRTGYKYTKAMGGDYYLKQTSMKYRNPANHPDAFEARILKEFESKGYAKGQGKGVVVTKADGSKVYRYMQPLYIKPVCLKCHGDPKGSKDIAGRIKEGYHEGDVRGAVSVMIPYPSDEVAQAK
ncbi:MAG: DUF3365 domain-containing protein [bacterium]